jgi:hypothetical protein
MATGYPEGERDFTRLLSSGVGYGVVVTSFPASLSLLRADALCIDRSLRLLRRHDEHVSSPCLRSESKLTLFPAVGFTKMQSRFTKLDPNSANEFMTASRSVRPGLVCCGCVPSSFFPLLFPDLSLSESSRRGHGQLRSSSRQQRYTATA